MDNTIHRQLLNYFKQQVELGIPDYIFATKDTVPDLYPSRSADPSEGVSNKRKDGDEFNNPKRLALIELYREIVNCHGCGLGASRNKLVFGAGNAAAPLMIIGEAPGFEEDRQGKPFVGKAGDLLTKMLAAINLHRERDAFITNILKCRPPENRNPNQAEAVACIPILKRQLRIVDPKAILVLGRIAAHELLTLSEGIGALRLELHTYKGIPVVVTYHPAALLRNERYKRPAWEDLKKLQNILREKGVYGNSK